MAAWLNVILLDFPKVKTARPSAKSRIVKAYIHMIIKSLDENIVLETLVTKSELFRDSLHVYSRDQPRDLEHIYKRPRPKCRTF